MLTDFTIWYAAQAEPVKIALIGAVITLWCALFAGALSVMVAWVQGRIAHRAVTAQERTIYLSLIERRAVWLDYAITTWSAWIDQQEHRIEAIVTNQSLPTDEPLRAIGNCRREARWLFGPEVDAFLQQLEVAVRDYSANRMAVRELGLLEPAERQKFDGSEREQAFQRSLMRMTTLRADLSDKTRPYLFVGDIRATSLP
ncbi:hypothetical protein [Sphingomonas sp. UYP23]